MDDVGRAEELLRAAGLRVTGPRRALLDVVLTAGPEHLTADDLAERVPDVHRATVYRTLEGLAALGVLTHVHLDRGVTAYHLADHAHLHAQCERCGAVVDLPVSVLGDTAARVRRASGFQVRPGHVALLGVCADCAATAARPGGSARSQNRTPGGGRDPAVRRWRG